MTKIEQALRDAGNTPVLWIDNEGDQDEFIFGTREKLDDLYYELFLEGKDCEIFTASELIEELKFSYYENNEPLITIT